MRLPMLLLLLSGLPARAPPRALRPRLLLLPRWRDRVSRSERVRARGRAEVARGLWVRRGLVRRSGGCSSVDEGEGVWLLLLLLLLRKLGRGHLSFFLYFCVFA